MERFEKVEGFAKRKKCWFYLSIYLPINANFNKLKVIAYTRKNKENKNREKSRKKKNVPL